MKHQALSRVISAVLAVMCLVTLISGVAGFVSAGKDFSQDRSDYKTLRDRIAEAESLDAQLNGGKDEYDKTAAELKAEKGQYDDDASRHREELTEYTATNAGLQMGSGSSGSAASTLEDGWKQYNAAREQFDAMEAEFNVGYDKYLAAKAQIESGWQEYNDGVAQIEQGKAAIAEGRAQYDAGMQQLEQGRAELARRRPQLADAEAALPQYEA